MPLPQFRHCPDLTFRPFQQLTVGCTTSSIYFAQVPAQHIQGLGPHLLYPAVLYPHQGTTFGPRLPNVASLDIPGKDNPGPQLLPVMHMAQGPVV